MNELIPLQENDFPIRHTYVSIPLPDSIKEKFADEIIKLKSSIPRQYLPVIRFQDPETAHLTFHFIGSTSHENLTILKENVHNFHSNLLDLPITISRVGHFNRRILFYEIESAELVEAFDTWRSQYPHWPLDYANFKPHLTIARFKGNPREFNAIYPCFKPWHETFIVDRLEIAGIYHDKSQTPLVSFN